MTTTLQELIEKHVAGRTTRTEQTRLWKLARKAGFKFVGKTADLEHPDGRYLAYRRFQ